MDEDSDARARARSTSTAHRLTIRFYRSRIDPQFIQLDT